MLIAANRFIHPYYFLRLLGCFPALLYWILVSIPANSTSAELIRFLYASQLTLSIPLIALPLLVLFRLRQLRKKFHLLSLSLETIFDTWLVNFLAFNLGSLAYLGGWLPATTYLTCLISFSIICPKPAYLGPSKLRIMDPEAFTSKILNRTYSSVVGFSASELLTLTPEKLKAEVDVPKPIPKDRFATKKWVIWPISEARKRSQVGLMDMEIILADLSLDFQDSDEIEFIILEMKNSNTLCSTLKIWTDDDSASSPIQPEVDDLVLLQYQAGREINRLPARQLYNDNNSSDEEELPIHDSHSCSPVVWSHVCLACSLPCSSQSFTKSIHPLLSSKQFSNRFAA